MYDTFTNLLNFSHCAIKCSSSTSLSNAIIISSQFKDNNNFYCKDIEIRRPGYTYSYETLELLHKEYPEYHFYFIFGADCLFSIEDWKYPERIFANCSIIAALRGDISIVSMQQKIVELERKYHADIQLLPFMQFEISSTMIRERLRHGQSIRYLVPDSVISYLEEKGLY